MARKIAISGSREYTPSWLVRDTIAIQARRYDGNVLFLIGDCPTGVDKHAKDFLDETSWKYREFFADWEKYGKKAGPLRNREMIDYGADELIAFPTDSSKGTKDCAKYAASKGVPVFFPELKDWHLWAAPLASMRN